MLDLENLPGVISQVNDYNLGNIQESDAATTESVLILGTTIDGPKGIALPIRSISDAITLYGDFKDANGTPNGSTLIRGIIEAYKSGCRDIRAMRVTGKLANRTKFDQIGNPNDDMLNTSALYDLSIEAKYEGSLYNNVSVSFDHVKGVMVVTKPSSKLTDGERQAVQNVFTSSLVQTVFKYSDFNMTADSSLSDFIRLINANANNNVLKFKLIDALGNDLTNSLIVGARALTIADIATLDETSNLISYYLSGGEDEISLDSIELYKRLGGYVTEYVLGADGKVMVKDIDSTTIPGYENAIYDLLVNYRTDNIVMMDGYADEDLCAFRNEDGSGKLVVEEKEFYSVMPASMPYIAIKLTSAILDSKGSILHAIGSTVSKIHLNVTASKAATSSIEISAPATVGLITMVETAGSRVLTIVPKTGLSTAKGIYNQIQTSNDILVEATTGANATPALYARDLIFMDLFIDSSLYTETILIPETFTTFVSYPVYSTTDNFPRQLAQACAVISSKNNECIGMIGCSSAPATDLVSLRNYINKLLGRKDSKTPAIHVSAQYDLYLKSAEGGKVYNDGNKPIDIGGYINIVAAPELVFADGVLGAYAASGAAAYAGLISTLPAENSTTNHSISGVVVPRYELSGQQLNDLTGVGYVTFRTSYNNGLVVTDGITAAGILSDFQRLTTKRITNAAMHLVRRVCEPFIGLPNSLAQRNALTTAIRAGLDGMVQAQALQDAEFTVYSSKQDQVLGNALIDLTIVPVFEFRKIKVYVNLKAPA